MSVKSWIKSITYLKMKNKSGVVLSFDTLKSTCTTTHTQVNAMPGLAPTIANGKPWIRSVTGSAEYYARTPKMPVKKLD